MCPYPSSPYDVDSLHSNAKRVDVKVKAMMAEADLDGDGVVSREEFHALMRGLELNQSEKKDADLLSWRGLVDRDNDPVDKPSTIPTDVAVPTKRSVPGNTPTEVTEGSAVVQYAGGPIRVVSSLLDGMLFWGAMIMFGFGLMIYTETRPPTGFAAFLFPRDKNTEMIGLVIAAVAAVPLLFVLKAVFADAQTPGKYLLGIKLVHKTTHQPIGVGYLVLRHIVRTIFWAFFGLGFIIDILQVHRPVATSHHDLQVAHCS